MKTWNGHPIYSNEFVAWIKEVKGIDLPRYQAEFSAQKKHEVDDVITFVCERLSIKKYNLLSRSRKAPNPIGRFICFALLRDRSGKQLTVIGEAFDRDHSTITNGLQTLSDLYDTDTHTRMIVDSCYKHFNLSYKGHRPVMEIRDELLQRQSS